MATLDVVVIGAGLAGLSCGYELIEKGREVAIFESRDVVGGRTSSWDEDGMLVESGLHRFLGYYEALPRLINNAGIEFDDIIVWEDKIEIRLPDGGAKEVFGAAPLFNPLETITGLLANNEVISLRDKVSLAPFFISGLRGFELKPQELDGWTVYDYALEHGVTGTAIENLLVPLTAGVFFLPPERHSAFAFFGLIAPYIPRLHNLRVGAFKGGLTEVMAEPIARYMEQRGASVYTGAGVERLLVEDG